MNVLVYTTLANDASQRLINIIAKVAQKERTEIFNTPDSLIDRLFQIRKDRTIVILLATHQKELSLLLSLYNFFEGFKLILILPDRKNQTMSKGHRLCPRYVSYSDGDFSDVGAVLNKMIANVRDGGKTPCQLTERMQAEEPEECLS